MKSHARSLIKQGLLPRLIMVAGATTLILPLPAWAAGGGHADISSLFYPVVNFTLYLAVMTYVYQKAVRPTLKKRKTDITDSINKAAGRLANAEKGLGQVKDRLASINQECQVLGQEFDLETEELAEHVLRDADKATKRVEDDIVKQVENALMRASHEVRSEIVARAVEQARAELKDHLSDEEDAAVREQVLAAF